MTRSVLEPLNELTSTMDEIASGDGTNADARLDADELVASSNEIATSARHAERRAVEVSQAANVASENMNTVAAAEEQAATTAEIDRSLTEAVTAVNQLANRTDDTHASPPPPDPVTLPVIRCQTWDDHVATRSANAPTVIPGLTPDDHTPAPASVAVAASWPATQVTRLTERQTWLGRNSQCQGSRGVVSTQPKRGPFTLSQSAVCGSRTSASTAMPQPCGDVPGTAASPPFW